MDQSDVDYHDHLKLGSLLSLQQRRAPGLPRLDRTDADGRPLWWGSTIDARTGRQVREDPLWLFRAPGRGHDGAGVAARRGAPGRCAAHTWRASGRVLPCHRDRHGRRG
ncbi:hypothetical protein AB0H12_29575 [Actinosynnema sp. NPDC023794]